MKASRIARRSTGIHPSLLDIAFVLVFMFLLLSTLASTTQQEAKERSLPPLKLAEMQDQAGAVGMTQAKVATISVQDGPAFFLDDEEMSLSDLREALILRHPPEVEIRGDIRVPYGDITEILKICQKNGINSVALTYKNSGN